MIPMLIGAAVGGLTGLLGANKARKDAQAAAAKADAELKAGYADAWGDGTPDGAGTGQKWYSKADGFLSAGEGAARPGADRYLTATGANGFDAMNDMATEFMAKGPHAAAANWAVDTQNAADNAAGRFYSGANAEAATRIRQQAGYGAWRDTVGDLKTPYETSMTFTGSRANLAGQTGQQVTGARMSLAGAAANNQNWLGNAMVQNNPFNGFINGAAAGAKVGGSFKV